MINKIKMALALASLALMVTPVMAGDKDHEEFAMVRSPALSTFPNFVPHAQGKVKIESVGPVEIMDVVVFGLPPNTDFDFFCNPGAQRAVWPFLVPGRHRDQ
jgi:hypothetical protein